MRRIRLLLALLVLSRSTGWPQRAPGTASPEPPAPTVAAPAADSAAPAKPDADGIYTRGAGLTLPRLTTVAPILYPPTAPASEPPRNSLLSLVVDEQGLPSSIKVIRSLNGEADQGIVSQASQLRFEPGTLDGKPVKMQVELAMHFFVAADSALPRVRWAGMASAAYRNRKYDKPPVPIHMAEAEYTDKARKARLQGIVRVSFTVTEEGLPTGIQVTRGLGMGLDEKAVDTVRQYRFRPAIKDGQPIAAQIDMEINYRLY